MEQECIAYPDHPWLQPILDHAHSSTFIKQVNSSMVPLFSYLMPNDVQQSLMDNYPKASPQFLGVDSNGDLQVSAHCQSDNVKMLINLTKDDPHPPCPLHILSLGSQPTGQRVAYSTHPIPPLSFFPFCPFCSMLNMVCQSGRSHPPRLCYPGIVGCVDWLSIVVVLGANCRCSCSMVHHRGM